jgi:hypothetical protein
LGLAAVMANSFGGGGGPLPPEQAAYAAAIPSWAAIGSWIGVVAGVAGSFNLIVRSWLAVPAFALSLAGVIAQDLWMFVLSDAASVFGSAPMIMQGGVLLIAVALLWLAVTGRNHKWLG